MKSAPTQLDLLPAVAAADRSSAPPLRARVNKRIDTGQLNPTGRRILELRFVPRSDWSGDRIEQIARVAVAYFQAIGGFAQIDQRIAADISLCLSELGERPLMLAIEAKANSLRGDKQFSAQQKAKFRGSVNTFFSLNRVTEWCEKHPAWQRQAREGAAPAQPPPPRREPFSKVAQRYFDERLNWFRREDRPPHSQPGRLPGREYAEWVARTNLAAFLRLCEDFGRKPIVLHEREVALSRLNPAQKRQLAGVYRKDFDAFVRSWSGGQVEPADARVDALLTCWRWHEAVTLWPALAEGGA